MDIPSNHSDGETTEASFNCSKTILCVKLILTRIGSTAIRIVDLAALIPSCLFLLFLIITASSVYRRFRLSNSRIMTTLYILIFIQAFVVSLRSVICILFDSFLYHVVNLDKALWLIVRCVTMFVEMAVITFGLGSAHLDSSTSVRRAILVTSLTAFTYCLIQGVCEFQVHDVRDRLRAFVWYPNQPFNPVELYQHGGSLFFFISSFTFFIVYLIILILPMTNLTLRLSLPTKTRFYVYCAILAVCNLTQALGSVLFYVNIAEGFCVVTLSTMLYFTLLNPLVYFTFLWQNLNYFKKNHNVYNYLEVNAEDINNPDLLSGHRREPSTRSLGFPASDCSLSNSHRINAERQVISTRRVSKQGSLPQGNVFVPAPLLSITSIPDGDTVNLVSSMEEQEGEAAGRSCGWEEAVVEGIPEFATGSSQWKNGRKSANVLSPTLNPSIKQYLVSESYGTPSHSNTQVTKSDSWTASKKKGFIS